MGFRRSNLSALRVKTFEEVTRWISEAVAALEPVFRLGTNRIQSYDVPPPLSADDLMFLQWNNDTRAFQYAAGGGVPSGPAGGALAGTYPNPTLAPVIVAGGPIGSSTVVPVITWNAAGQLTVVSTANIAASFVEVPITTSTVLSGTEDQRANINTVPAAGLTVTLPTASGKAGQIVVVCDTVGTEPTTGYLSVLRGGSDLIEGVTRWSFRNGFCSITLQSDGVSKWTVITTQGLVAPDMRSFGSGPVYWYDAGRGTTVSTSGLPNAGYSNQTTALLNMGSAGSSGDLVSIVSCGPQFLAGTGTDRPGLLFIGAAPTGMKSSSTTLTWNAADATIFIVTRRRWATSPSATECLFAFGGVTVGTNSGMMVLVPAATVNIGAPQAAAGDIIFCGNGAPRVSGSAPLIFTTCKHSVAQFNGVAGTIFATPIDGDLAIVGASFGSSAQALLNETPNLSLAANLTGTIPTLTSKSITLGCVTPTGTSPAVNITHEVVVFNTALSAADILGVAKALNAIYRVRG